jgi:hypothetical protein
MPDANRLLAIVPALVLCAAAVSSLNMGIAGTTAVNATNALGSANAGELHRALERVLSVDSGDPSVHELLGQTSEYPAEAAVHFRQSLERRPMSSYTWANLAASDYRSGDTAAEFRTAIVRAMELGPNEPEVQRTVADFGLALWNELDSSTQGVVEEAIARAMRYQPKEILQIAQRRGRVAVACRHAAGIPRQTDAKWLQPCQSTEATS